MSFQKGSQPAPRSYRPFRPGPDVRLVATSHPLATHAAYWILDRGGNPVDAAIAAAAVLTVVEPGSTGIGGDLFAQVWPSSHSRPSALCAAGPAPALMTLDATRARGWKAMPRSGPWSITVPGALRGWESLMQRHGTLPFELVLSPAIRLAERGFVVTPRVARGWANSQALLNTRPATSDVFLPGGRAPAANETFSNPGFAETLRRIARHGVSDFYEGVIADAIAKSVESEDGPLRLEDLSSWTGSEWVEPLSVEFEGHTVYQPPPPGQGVIALLALSLYRQLRRGADIDDTHLAVEALKWAFEDGRQHVGDPTSMGVEAADLLLPSRLGRAAEEIYLDKAVPARVGRGTDTTYVAVADVEWGACSLIQSLYQLFGSGLTVADRGFLLHSRAADFDLEQGHPNRLEPGKKPYHTIMPGMLGRNGTFAGCIGVVGGFMQPQGQVQVLRNLLEKGLTPQEAVDAPRFRIFSGADLRFEKGWPPHLVRRLGERGHQVQRLHPDMAGAAQIIFLSDRGLEGGSDHRKDGLGPLQLPPNEPDWTPNGPS